MPKKIRILFLTLRADIGGGPEHLWKLLKNAPTDVQIYVACPQDYPYYERYCSCVGEGNIFIVPHRRVDLKKLWQLRTFCRKYRIDVLHSHGKGAGVYARPLSILTGLPCVHTFHGVHINSYGSLKKNLYRIAERIMSLFTRVGISVSAGEMDQILKNRLINQAKIRLIENGVSFPDKKSKVSEIKPYTVVSMSRFDMQKNSEFILNIIESLYQIDRLNDFRFIVIGEGQGRAKMENTARDHNFGQFLNCVGISLKPQHFFEGALAYLSTSLWEGMPLSVIEAMAHGIPPVVTDVVGNRDAVADHKTGLIYPVGDAAAAANALCLLADDPVFRHVLGENAREYARQHHNVQEMASATFKLLKNVAYRPKIK